MTGLKADLTVAMLRSLLSKGDSLTLVDVREAHECAGGMIEGAVMISMSELEESYRKLDRAATIVVYCQHGIRSGKAARFLRKEGFMDVRHLVGGYAAWLSGKST